MTKRKQPAKRRSPAPARRKAAASNGKTLLVAEMAVAIGVSKNTIRRWFVSCDILGRPLTGTQHDVDLILARLARRPAEDWAPDRIAAMFPGKDVPTELRWEPPKIAAKVLQINLKTILAAINDNRIAADKAWWKSTGGYEYVDHVCVEQARDVLQNVRTWADNREPPMYIDGDGGKHWPFWRIAQGMGKRLTVNRLHKMNRKSSVSLMDGRRGRTGPVPPESERWRLGAEMVTEDDRGGGEREYYVLAEKKAKQLRAAARKYLDANGKPKRSEAAAWRVLPTVYEIEQKRYWPLWMVTDRTGLVQTTLVSMCNAESVSLLDGRQGSNAPLPPAANRRKLDSRRIVDPRGCGKRRILVIGQQDVLDLCEALPGRRQKMESRLPLAIVSDGSKWKRGEWWSLDIVERLTGLPRYRLQRICQKAAQDDGPAHLANVRKIDNQLGNPLGVWLMHHDLAMQLQKEHNPSGSIDVGQLPVAVQEHAGGENWSFDLAGVVRIGNRSVELREKERAILEILFKAPNHIADMQRLMEPWGDDVADEQNVRMTISRLRSALRKRLEFADDPIPVTSRGANATWRLDRSAVESAAKKMSMLR